MFIVKEREINFKHQQLISGVSLFAYWLSNLLVDCTKMFIVNIWTAVMVLAFQVDSFTDYDHYGAVWLICLVSPMAIISFTYLTSFMFKSPAKAQMCTFGLCFFLGLILVFFAQILRVIESTRNTEKNYLEYFYRLFPFFTFCFGFFNIGTTQITKIIYKYHTEPKALSWAISWPDILYLFLEGFLFFGLIFVVEYWKKIKSCCGCTKSKVTQANEIAKECEAFDAKENPTHIKKSLEVDDDVLIEEEFVKNSNEFTIKLENLKKIYKLEGGGCCKSGKNVSYKVAVKDVTFGVQNGECFGLLGTNGAGKTTVFKVLTGECLPSSGKVHIAGLDVSVDLNSITSKIGYCPQFDALLERLTAREH